MAVGVAPVDIALGVTVGVAPVDVALGVPVGVACGDPVKVAVAGTVGVNVAVALGEAFGVVLGNGVKVTVGVAVTVEVGVEVAVAVAVGVGFFCVAFPFRVTVASCFPLVAPQVIGIVPSSVAGPWGMNSTSTVALPLGSIVLGTAPEVMT